MGNSGVTPTTQPVPAEMTPISLLARGLSQLLRREMAVPFGKKCLTATLTTR
jgi:hypothetical protein